MYSHNRNVQSFYPLSIAFSRLQNNDRHEFSPNKLAIRGSMRYNSIQLNAIRLSSWP